MSAIVERVDSPVTERRRRTEDRILKAAQALFAQNDYEKTTIRAVATAADVDPALVIRYFGDKEGLFRLAVRLPEAATDEGEDVGGSESGPDALAEQLVGSLGAKLGGLSPATLALVRSMFTHPEAAEKVRTAMGEEIGRLGCAAPPEPDVVLRAGLAAAMMLGITIGRQMLDVPALTDASVADIQRVMRPVLHLLMEPGQGSR